MHKTGVVSVSFRKLSPEEVAQAMVKAGLKYVEWGSDVHAPCTDEARLEEIVELQKKYDITCSSYGTYFRLGFNPIEEFSDYIKAAKKLGTNILRLWAGKKSSYAIAPEDKVVLFEQSRQVAKMAEEAGVILCLECHHGTYTETPEGALELIQAVNSPNFRTYWQPNWGLTVQENVAYIRALKPYIDHLHVYYYENGAKHPLNGGLEQWKAFVAEFPEEHTLLLEFMPDNRVESLPAEAEALRKVVAES